MTPHTYTYFDYRQGLAEDPYQYFGGMLPYGENNVFWQTGSVSASSVVRDPMSFVNTLKPVTGKGNNRKGKQQHGAPSKARQN